MEQTASNLSGMAVDAATQTSTTSIDALASSLKKLSSKVDAYHKEIEVMKKELKDLKHAKNEPAVKNKEEEDEDPERELDTSKLDVNDESKARALFKPLEQHLPFSTLQHFEKFDSLLEDKSMKLYIIKNLFQPLALECRHRYIQKIISKFMAKKLLSMTSISTSETCTKLALQKTKFYHLLEVLFCKNEELPEREATQQEIKNIFTSKVRYATAKEAGVKKKMSTDKPKEDDQ